MRQEPALEEIFAVMAAASGGDTTVRVPLADVPDMDNLATRFAISLNLLLDDLEFRVDERKRIEERLQQSQKMEAIGNLAGGIAHDFNNILSVILGYSELALASLRPADAAGDDILEVKRAAERARDLTQQLLAFSRKQILSPRVLQLGAVLLDMESMVRRLLGSGVRLSIQAPPGLPRIEADPSQLQQIIMNLAVNARDAMPNGGDLTIELAEIVLDGSYASSHPDIVPGPHVLLAISDSGVGMLPEVRARIFEPFFTTKQKGTGLGLATVFGIVRQSGAHITVYSEANRGTTFKVYFPVTDKAPAPSEPPSVTVPSQVGSETILVVEDDDQVRALAEQILSRNGYHVLLGQNAGEGILICETFQGAIHLLLTDVVMPHVTGRALAERLAPLRPDMRVLYMSGYADHAIVHHGVLDACLAFLQKPFSSQSLLEKVRDVLGRPTAPA
jgi:two-component system cell cycle sensor histidine kinase/response regulator CckA